ncbi:MAG: hypothetical protein QM622_11680 [Microbacterium sp.]
MGEESDPAASAEATSPAPLQEPQLPTEVVQTIQRRNWTRIIVGVTAAIVGLIGLGWAAGAVSNLLG